MSGGASSGGPFQPELRPRIREKLDRLDLSKYKDSMIPLLLKDMNELRMMMEEQK